MSSENSESPLAKMARGEPIERNRIQIIGTPDTTQLAEHIRDRAQALLDMSHGKNPSFYPERNIILDVIDDYKFFNVGEPNVTLPGSVRGNHTWVVSDPHGDFNNGMMKTKFGKDLSINDKYQHDKLLLGAVRNNGARTTNMLMPCVYGARQDKTTPRKRQPITVKQTLEEIDNIIGNDGMMYMLDLHNPTSEVSIRNGRSINFYTGWAIRRSAEMLGLDPKKITLIPADEGGIKKIEGISKDIGCEAYKSIKTRDYDGGGEVVGIHVFGDLTGKDVFVHDDILDSGTTLCTLIDEILKLNPKSVSIMITHGMFTGEARKKLENTIRNSDGKIKKVFVTDSVHKEHLPDFVEVLSTGQLFANAIVNPQSVNKDDANDYTGNIGSNVTHLRSRILKPVVRILERFIRVP